MPRKAAVPETVPKTVRKPPVRRPRWGAETLTPAKPNAAMVAKPVTRSKPPATPTKKPVRASKIVVPPPALLTPGEALRQEPGMKPQRTTGQWLMALRKLIQDTTGKPWPQIAMLNPIMDGPYDPFVLKARLPGGNQWVGEYDPASITDADLPGMVADLLAVREQAEKESEPQVDEDGEPLSNPRVIGTVHKIPRPNGGEYEVVATNRAPVESITQEAARVEREIRTATTQRIFHEGQPQFVQINGVERWIMPGMNEDVPAPIADVYWLGRIGERMPAIDLDSRMAAGQAGLPSKNELDRILAGQIQPGRHG